jgi:predicted transposase/invertase (TIGR01784 family)
MQPLPLEPIHLNRTIDPLVDCVFKALFGEESNKALLIDFLNSVLQREVPIEDVTFINPINDKTRLDEKLTCVDVKARDTNGEIFQVDVQLALHAALKERMLFNGATIYGFQLKKKEEFKTLKPVTSIWILKQGLWRDDLYHHRFEMYDQRAGLRLSDHLTIHTLELGKWQPSPLALETQAGQWLHFLKEANTWHDLPKAIEHSPLMRQAMTTLKQFSDDEKAYFLYLSQMDRERVQITLEAEAAQARQDAKLASEALTRAQEEAKRAEEAAAQVVARSQEEAKRAEEAATQAAARAEQESARAEQESARAEQESARAEQESARAEQESARAEQESARAEQESARAKQESARAEQESAARKAAQQDAAEARLLAQEARLLAQETERLRAQADQAQAAALRDTLRSLYEARFGPIPQALSAALAVASLKALTDSLPVIATATQDTILALRFDALP